MAKLGMTTKGKPPVFTAKLADDDLTKIINTSLPPKEFFQKYALEIAAELQVVLHNHLDSAKADFVKKLSLDLEVGFVEDDLPIIPDHCRYFHVAGNHVILILESSPQVRTLTFGYDGADQVISSKVLGGIRKEKYRLAFPYCVFIISASKSLQRYFFEKLYVAYRKSPFTGNREDMLLLPNLPNMGSPELVLHSITPNYDPDLEGYANTENDFSVCMGASFSCEARTPAELSKRILDHFWMASFNQDLSSNFIETGKRDSRLINITTWEKNTEANQLFVLDANWFPGVKLGTFLGKIAASRGKDRIAEPGIRAMNALVAKAYNQVWKEAKARNLDNSRLATAFCNQIDGIMRKFAAKLGMGLANLPRDDVRRQVQTAVAEALRDSVR